MVDLGSAEPEEDREYIKVRAHERSGPSSKTNERCTGTVCGLEPRPPRSVRGQRPRHSGTTEHVGGASLQPGGFDTGSSQPRRVVNQTIGAVTNHSVPVWPLCRRFANGSEAYIKKGQFVFLYRPDTQQTFSRVPMENMVNLPMVNYYLAQLCVHSDHGDHWRHHMTAAQVAESFTSHGVVLVSQGGEGDRSNQERMLNCTDTNTI